MKDGAVVCNSGHFNVEVDLEGLSEVTKENRTMRDFVEEYLLENGRRVYVLGEGRLINLASAEGHPSSVMDMSFANQALCASHLLSHGKEFENRVYGVPREIDERIARLKLESMNVHIDVLTDEQKTYLASWEQGT
jgi:adenosylhomocysteinase